MLTIEERLNHYTELFQYSKNDVKACYEAFLDELQKGLEAHAKNPKASVLKDSSLAMLDTCVKYLPTLKEKGVFFALDFGGSNARALRCELDGQGKFKTNATVLNLREIKTDPELPKGLLDKSATASMLFDVFAKCIGEMLAKEKGASGRMHHIGFTFSFPVKQLGANNALLSTWSKDFETGINTKDAVIGADVGALLDRALSRNNVKAKTAVILNDTVGCMLSGTYVKDPSDPPCLVGVILGTGMNGAFALPYSSYGYDGIVVNTELGNFNKSLKHTDVDFEIDFLSAMPGHHIAEKMASGLYITELVRLLILRIFQDEAPEQAWIQSSLSGEGCGVIFSEPERTKEILKIELDWDVTSELHLDYVKKIVNMVFNRSAAIAAAMTAGLCKKTGMLQPAMGGLTVAVDGSLYNNNPVYQQMFQDYIRSVFDGNLSELIKFVIAQDGSGLGATLSAAAVCCAK